MTKDKPVANEANTPDESMTPIKDVIKAKLKHKTTKPQKVWLNCTSCNKAYRDPVKLEKHEQTCDGKHPGGMPKGRVNERTKTLNEQKKALQERIAAHADQLFNAQFNLAVGQTMLFVQIKERDSKGKVIRVYHERVESQETIKEYLDDENAINDDEHYYYITTKPANNQALTNLLDRAFGKPKENIELGEDPDAPLPVHGTGTTTELRKAMIAMVKQQLKDARKK